MTQRVFVTRKLPGDGIDILRQQADVEVWPGDLPPDRKDLLAAAANADGLIALLTDTIDEQVLAAAPQLKVISNIATGYDNIDLEAATNRGIAVTNTPGVLDETTADFAFALLMAAGRRVAEADRFVRAGRWQTWSPTLLLGQDIHNATLGVIGMGGVGAAMARRARGFGMELLYHSRSRRHELEAELGMTAVNLADLLRLSDFISVHVPLTNQTRGLLGARQFGLMKPTAILINTARGGVIDEHALARALESGQIAGAGLDVVEHEPLDSASPLMTMENVVVAPHIASASFATRAKMSIMAVESCLAALRGERPPNCLNAEIYANGAPPEP